MNIRKGDLILTYDIVKKSMLIYVSKVRKEKNDYRIFGRAIDCVWGDGSRKPNFELWIGVLIDFYYPQLFRFQDNHPIQIKIIERKQ